MTKEVKIVPRNIQLFRIEVIESSIRESPIEKTSEFKINVAHTIMHNLKDERLKIGLHIELNGKENPETVRADFVIDFHFKIKNFTDFYVLKENNRLTFSGLLIATLLGLSFSTARGIIFEKFSNTKFQGVILPVVDPKEMLQKV